MNAPDFAWEQRLEQAWRTIDDLPAEAFVEQIERLAAELPPHSAIGHFERACAQDSTGHPDQAVPLYRYAAALLAPPHSP
jgi:Tetratrico peptide repeat